MVFGRASPGTKQHVVALIASLGGFIMGLNLGWMSPAGPMMEDGQYAFKVTSEDISWIASLMPLGALISCPIMGTFLVDKLGRKTLTLLLMVPTLGGWALIICAQTVHWVYAGRTILGFVCGSLSIIVPLYTTEIAEKERRGALGSYFQLQATGGIAAAYTLGSFMKLKDLSSGCAALSLIGLILILLIPESPYYNLMKKDSEKARATFKFLLGSDEKANQETESIRKFLAETDGEKISLGEAFRTKASKRALIIGLGSMVFQQFGGCNAVIFYSTSIFNETGSTLKSSTSTIIIGVVQVFSTLLSLYVVDILGRKFLLLVSAIVMGLCTFLIGGYFYGQHIDYDVSKVTLIPLVSVCVFIVAFSIGFGPIPWMLMGEIFPARIKVCWYLCCVPLLSQNPKRQNNVDNTPVIGIVFINEINAILSLVF